MTRDLDVGELWSGVGNVAAAARDNGHTAAEFDLDRVPGYTNVPGPSSEDITTEAGFLKALGLVLRLRPAGLLWMGPLCSSFVFPDSSHCKRKASNFDGDTTYPPVSQGNLMAVIAAFLVQVALARGVHAAIENPAGSTFWSFIRGYCKLLDCLNFQVTPRCAFDDDPLPKISKKYKVNGSGAWVRRLQRNCNCPDGEHQMLMHDAESGRTGNKELLKASGAYPPRFGAAVIGAWEAAGPVCAALQEVAANTEWTQKTSKPVDVQQDKKRETPKKKKSPWDSQEAAANTAWTQKASRPVDVHEDKKRETPEKKTSPWDSQEFLGDQGSAPKKTRRSSPWNTEQPSTKEELAPKATSRPGPWGTEQAVCKSPKPPCATARRRGPWD